MVVSMCVAVYSTYASPSLCSCFSGPFIPASRLSFIEAGIGTVSQSVSQTQMALHGMMPQHTSQLTMWLLNMHMHHWVAMLFAACLQTAKPKTVHGLCRPNTSEAVPGAFVIILAQEPESSWTFCLRQVPLWLARVVQVVGNSYKLHYFARCRCI